jgi:hypothetical protein
VRVRRRSGAMPAWRDRCRGRGVRYGGCGAIHRAWRGLGRGGRRLEAASGTGVCCWPWSRSANGKPGARRSLRCSPGLVQGARRRAGGDRSAAGDSRRECPCPAIPAGPVRAAGGLSFIRRIMSNTSISCRPALGCAVDSCRSSYGCQAPDGCGPWIVWGQTRAVCRRLCNSQNASGTDRVDPCRALGCLRCGSKLEASRRWRLLAREHRVPGRQPGQLLWLARPHRQRRASGLRG